jgi:hypothetical protein
LKATVHEGGKHRRFEIQDAAGRVVATTSLSRSWRDRQTLGANMVAMIQAELGLQGAADAFAALLACPLTRDAYLELVTGDGEPA